MDSLLRSSTDVSPLAAHPEEILDIPEQFDEYDFGLKLNCILDRTIEPDDAITTYSGGIFLCGEGPERLIGQLGARVVDLDLSEDHVFDVLDCVDQVTADHLVLFRSDGQLTPAVTRLLDEPENASTNLLLIDRLEVLPEARGRGLTPLVLDLLTRKLGRHCRIAVLKPFPLQHEGGFATRTDAWSERMGYSTLDADYATGMRKLKRLYRECGFVSVPRTQYMVRDLQPY